jgi:hypothetical protein
MGSRLPNRISNLILTILKQWRNAINSAQRQFSAPNPGAAIL